MVSSRVLIFTLRISRERSSRAAIIFTAWPGILGETVFRRTLGPENLTSTSAMADFELATGSLTLSMEEVLEEQGDGSTEPGLVGDR